MIFGELIIEFGELELNVGLLKRIIMVVNIGD